MQTKSAALLLFALLCGALSLTGCGQPADSAFKELISLTNKHQKKVEDGSWDKAAFEADMKPVVEKLKALKKDHPDLPISKSVSDDFEASSKRFNETCDKKGNTEASNAYSGVMLEVAFGS